MIFGSITLIFKEKIFSTILNSQLTVKEGTASYNAWVETPIPVYTKFYFFDMLNPSDLFYKHEKPILEERGPYTFRETQKKVNVTFHANGTVTYKRLKTWYFVREMSVGDLTDVVTTINVPVVGSAEFVRGSYWGEMGISDMLTSLEATIFVKRSVGELLFDGYEDTVMTIGSSFSDTGAGYDEDYYEDYYDLDAMDDMDDDTEESDEEDEEMGRFGWFYNRNGTYWADGELEMFTGEDDIEKLGEIVSWNHENKTDAFTGECGKVRGSADGLFPPGIASITDTLSIYSTDLCRPIHFSKAGEHSMHGIPVTTFELDSSNFANTTVCPDNECYQNNIPNGVQNVTQCKMKSPAFVSRPHFYKADESYIKQFQYGMMPDPAKHDSVFWVEPESSIPVKVEMRLQLNILLRKVEGIEYLFKNLQEVMYPVFWFESVSDLPEHMAAPLSMLIMLPVIMSACGIFSIVSGFIIIFFVIVCRVLVLNQDKEKELNKDDHQRSSIIKQYSKVPIQEMKISDIDISSVEKCLLDSASSASSSS